MIPERPRSEPPPCPPSRQLRLFIRFVLSALLAATFGTGLPVSGLGQAGREAQKFFTLDNGLKVFLLENNALPLVHIVAAVDAGTKNETEATSGLVHMLEHCALFRGTQRRSGEEVGRDIRRHGAYFNAHSGLDLALFEISLPSSEADFGLENQKEILFDLKITAAEVETERSVILEELSLVADDPDRYASGLVCANVFAGHPYALPIQGNPESLKGLAVGDLESFYKKFFVPANMSLAVVGDFEAGAMEQSVRRVFGGLPRTEYSRPAIPAATGPAKDVDLVVEMDVTRATCVIGMLAPDYNHADQYAADLLTEILGRGVNPMLSGALRSPRDLVETASMVYHAHHYGGLLLVYLSLDPKNLKGAKREALNFLKSSRQLNFSKDDYIGEEKFYAFDYLLSAKNQVRFQSRRAQEKGLNVATSLARYMLLHDDPGLRDYLGEIERLSSSDLRKAAGRYLSAGKKVVVSVVPRAKRPAS